MAERNTEFVIVRCRDAGVHCGYFVSCDGRQVVLTDASVFTPEAPESGRICYWHVDAVCGGRITKG